MAAAIILIPEMLSGPERAPEQNTAQSSAETNVKTYTIDLADPAASQSQRSSPSPAVPSHSDPVIAQNAPEQTPTANPEEIPQSIPESAPPPEHEGVTPTPSRAASTSESPTRSAVREPESRPATPAPPPAQARTEESAPPALASAPSVPTTKGWAVQLGSFSSAASAQRLANEFRAQGFDAFVMPVKTGSATLYRVRLGPMKDRATAEGVLKRAKAKVSGAAIVTHP